jgi:hypothetical protein
MQYRFTHVVVTWPPPFILGGKKLEFFVFTTFGFSFEVPVVDFTMETKFKFGETMNV